MIQELINQCMNKAMIEYKNNKIIISPTCIGFCSKCYLNKKCKQLSTFEIGELI